MTPLEPPIDPPSHPFEDVTEFDLECPACDYDGDADVIELLDVGFVVRCPACEQEITIEFQ